jgi:hypothetical protein
MVQSLDTIQKMQFVGNHNSDYGKFEIIDSFIKDPGSTMAEKKLALQHMLKNGMGDNTVVTTKMVTDMMTEQ